MFSNNLKETVGIIPSDPQSEDGNARFTTKSFKAL